MQKHDSDAFALSQTAVAAAVLLLTPSSSRMSHH